MDLLAEFLIGLFLEGGTEVAKSREVPRWLRLLAGVSVLLFMFAVLGGLCVLGIWLCVCRSLFGGAILLAVDLLLILLSFFKIKKAVGESKKEGK